MRKRIVLLVVIILLLCAWAPWLSRASAERIAADRFTAGWQGVIDGCGLNCQGCGVEESARIPFGYQVRLEYACGLIPADLPEYHRYSTGFVSFLGTVHGYRSPH